MTEKQAILRDLKVIAILDKKIDYSDHENIGAVLKLNPKSLFSTEYGKRYLDRIKQMYDGDDYEHTCVLCGTPVEGENPVCKNCYAMITLGNASVPEKPQPVVTEKASTEKPEPEPKASEDEPSPVEAETEPSPEEAEHEPSPVEAEHEPSPEETEPEKTEEPEIQEEQPAEEEEHLTDDELAEVPPEELIERAEEEETSEIPEDEEKEEGEEKVQEQKEKFYDPDPMTKKGRDLDLARALILLFTVACFSIAVVCGLILIIRDLRIRYQDSKVREEVVLDSDLRDHYSIIQTDTGHRITVEDES